MFFACVELLVVASQSSSLVYYHWLCLKLSHLYIIYWVCPILFKCVVLVSPLNFLYSCLIGCTQSFSLGYVLMCPILFDCVIVLIAPLNLVWLCYSIDCAPQSSSSLAKQNEIPSYSSCFTCKMWSNTMKEPLIISGIWISQSCILLGVPDLVQLCRNFVCASPSLSLVRNGGGTQRKSLQLYWGFGFLTCVLLGVPYFVQLCRNVVCASHLLLHLLPSRKKCHHSVSFTCKKWKNTRKEPPILLRIWIVIASHIHHKLEFDIKLP
jgi:hypothetical protein